MSSSEVARLLLLVFEEHSDKFYPNFSPSFVHLTPTPPAVQSVLVVVNSVPSLSTFECESCEVDIDLCIFRIRFSQAKE